MKNLMTKFFKEEDGNIIEYIILLAVIAGVIVALFPGLKDKIIDWFNNMIGNVDDGIGSDTCKGKDGTTEEGKITQPKDDGTCPTNYELVN